MAATGRRTALLFPIAAALSLLPMSAQASDLLEPVNHIASALSSNNAADALTPVDKSFAGYEQLQRYFAAICDGYSVSNEADVLEQNESAQSASLNVRWTLTLTSQVTNENIRRSQTVHLQLSRKKRGWKIVDLQPISFFDPETK